MEPEAVQIDHRDGVTPVDTSVQNTSTEAFEGPPVKRARLNEPVVLNDRAAAANKGNPWRMRGVAPVKAEYLVYPPESELSAAKTTRDDDLAEATPHQEREQNQKRSRRREKGTGQNTGRKFGRSQDEKGLCSTRAFHPEFSPAECSYSVKCKFEHDLRKYLNQYKREDLKTFNGVCPIWKARGTCPSGWKCRFVSSHMNERDTPDGRRELILVEDEARKAKSKPSAKGANADGIVNSVSLVDKIALTKKKTQTQRADAYTAWLDKISKELEMSIHGRHQDDEELDTTSVYNEQNIDVKEQVEETRAQYTEPPFLPSEKRKVYFGPETPVLAPLTTQGNLPFRRLCIDLGAQLTYSEMAMSMPLIQGSKSEWALMKAHESEMEAPTISSKASIVKDYDNPKDLRFGSQIAANKPWQALKATEVLSALCPHLRVIDLNCGCPIDLVYREGAGSALLDHPSKLEKILRGMNAVSDQIPITVKVRMGTKDNSPNTLKLVERLTLGGYEASRLGVGPPGVAAVTLHGRSRQQRYTKQADWVYISECAALVKRLREKEDRVVDTIRESDERLRPAGGRVYFLGNGDCFSYEDYNDHVRNANVDSVMIARGALIKPWIFEEIQSGQYLDKSASERLTLVEKFARYGLEAWGSDEYGVGTTRRFLLEWLSFAHRYIPVGLLEYLPPNIQDRPPAWRGRNDLETLLGSENYKDWIKITEMFLGPVHKDFSFQPKHKSNAYEAETQG